MKKIKVLFALKFSQKTSTTTTATMGYHRLLKYINTTTAFTESQFLPSYGKIVLVGSAILPVETAIAVPTSIILVGTVIAVSTGRNCDRDFYW